MDALKAFFAAGHTAQYLVAFAVVAAGGLALARLQFRGVGIGVAGVLFAGLVCGRLGLHVDPHVLEFVREFGLILFVFSIGLQLGPGFFASLRRTGLKLNLLAAANVVLGVGLCVAVLFITGLPVAVAAGLLSGATTNTRASPPPHRHWPKPEQTKPHFVSTVPHMHSRILSVCSA